MRLAVYSKVLLGTESLEKDGELHVYFKRLRDAGFRRIYDSLIITKGLFCIRESTDSLYRDDADMP